MRNMSFAITTQQVMDEIKDVTRRNGWWNLKRGDLICAVKKGMGLKKGEKIERLKVLRVEYASDVILNTITPDDVRREGFAGQTPEWFIEMFCKSHKGITPMSWVNRIEFSYVDDLVRKAVASQQPLVFTETSGT